jgi:hypothetical protein
MFFGKLNKSVQNCELTGESLNHFLQQKIDYNVGTGMVKGEAKVSPEMISNHLSLQCHPCFFH